MRIISFILMGILNLSIVISSFWNNAFWNSILKGSIFKIEGFSEFLTALFWYATAVLFAHYCFSIKARGDERFWKLNFAANAINLLNLSSVTIFANMALMSHSRGEAALIYPIALVVVITTLNLALLLYRVPRKIIENINVPIHA